MSVRALRRASIAASMVPAPTGPPVDYPPTPGAGVVNGNFVVPSGTNNVVKASYGAGVNPLDWPYIYFANWGTYYARTAYDGFTMTFTGAGFAVGGFVGAVYRSANLVSTNTSGVQMGRSSGSTWISGS